MRRRGITLFAFALLLAWARGAAAQTSCEDALRDAEKSYELGLFEDVPTQLAPCVAMRLTRKVAVQVRSLLARAYLNNEEPEKARKEISTILSLESTFEPEAGSSPRFVALVAQVRREELTTQVVSVSKTTESLREAPATVVVITAEDIRRRGYIDFEQILHDLPGFDISRLNGPDYSLVYQRGFNSPANDRLLFLVDGVEQNDLTLNTPYFSREYSLSDIDRVEVIYGPASTMYGANAYTGLISIITREPESLIGENKRFGIVGQATAGGYGTQNVDVTAAGTNNSGAIAWSVMTNIQQSGARGLSHLDPWDYTYRNFDYKTFMRLPGTPDERAALCAQSSPYIRCSDAGIELTDKGVDFVRGIDTNLVRDNGLGFDDRARNWSIYGKLKISNLTIGLQSWRSQEGVGSTQGNLLAGNTSWTPKETSLFLKYTIPLDAFKLNIFTRYVQTTLDRARSTFEYLHNFASGDLTLYSLVPPCRSPLDQKPVGCAPASAWIENVHFGDLSSQIRNEVSILYERSPKLNVVAGVELAKSSVQSQYDQIASGPGDISRSSLGTPEQIEHTDAALYTQGSFRLRRSLRFVAAGRLSYNQINNKPGAHGYGALFTPRLGAIYSPFAGRLVLKAIYSEAFKDPTDLEKFGLLAHLIGYASNGLRPERVRNVESSAGWEEGRVSVEGSVYQAHYTDVVDIAYPRLPDGSLVPDCVQDCIQYQNRNEILVRGLQATARYKLARSQIWSNYTHTQPEQLHPLDFFGNPAVDTQGNPVRSLREADIAENQVNLGIDTNWADRFTTVFRFHYVSPRKTGEGTTNSFTPFTQMDAHSTADVTLSYRNLVPNATLQLIVNNLFNKNYYDGGTIYTVPRVLQSGRTIYLRLIYGPRSGK
ncbi:MAG TPA: TonB-dependent receptor [Thermoanaerobaculia bacterium]